MIVLDTHVLLFDALAPERLSAEAAKLIEGCWRTGQLHISDVTLTEVAWLAQAGRLELGGPTELFLTTALAARNITVLAVTPAIAALAAKLPLHKDPADRLIAATTLGACRSIPTRS